MIATPNSTRTRNHGMPASGPLSMKELRAEADRIGPPEIIVKGLLHTRGLALIDGFVTTGLDQGNSHRLKTYLITSMASSIAAGSAWLGHARWDCPVPRRVGLIVAPPPAFQPHDLNLIFPGDDSCPPGCDFLVVAPTFPSRSSPVLWIGGGDLKGLDVNLCDPASLTRLMQVIGDEGLEVLFLSPLAAFVGGQYEALTDAADGSTGALRVMQALYDAGAACREVGCTLVVVHHPLADDWHCPIGEVPGIYDVCAPAGSPMKQWIVMGLAADYDYRSGQTTLWLGPGNSMGCPSDGLSRLVIAEGCDDGWQDYWNTSVESVTHPASF